MADESLDHQLIVYTGPMFSGKTSALIAELEYEIQSNPDNLVKVYKPVLDVRYDAIDIKTHEGYSLKDLTGIEVTPVSLDHDFEDAKLANFVAIDEVQFFGKNIVPAVKEMIARGTNVVLSGLNVDSDGKPFGHMPELLELASYSEELFASCAVCEGPANRTFRTTAEGGQILVGGSNFYEPRCEQHWAEGM